MVVVGVEVEYELSFARYALTVVYYGTKASSAGARVVHLVAWCVLSGHHATACATIQNNFDHDVLPVVDVQNGFVFLWFEDDLSPCCNPDSSLPHIKHFNCGMVANATVVNTKSASLMCADYQC